MRLFAAKAGHEICVDYACRLRCIDANTYILLLTHCDVQCGNGMVSVYIRFVSVCMFFRVAMLAWYVLFGWVLRVQRFFGPRTWCC